MRTKSFSLSVQGASHIKRGKICQDASQSYEDDLCAIAVVCDGHGGDDYVRSQIGARFAAELTIIDIQNFIKNVNEEDLKQNPKKCIRDLESAIINDWNKAIESYHIANPFLEEEIAQLSNRARKRYLMDGRIESAYGTTLIAVAVTKTYWFGIHIGDGKCVAVNPEGQFRQPIPWDKKCFLNATTSICDSDALNNFRHFFSEKLPVAVFIGSDGIDDSFKSVEQLYNLYKTAMYSFATTEFDKAVEGLKDYLPRLSAQGSGDDVSIAAILDMDMLGEIDVVKNFNKEEEAARKAANAERAAAEAKEERRRIEEERAKRLRERERVKMKFCTNCGEKLTPGAKFCSNCGCRIGVPAITEPPAPEPQNPEKSAFRQPSEKAQQVTAVGFIVEEPEEAIPEKAVPEKSEEPAEVIPVEPVPEKPEEPAEAEPAAEPVPEAVPEAEDKPAAEEHPEDKLARELLQRAEAEKQSIYERCQEAMNTVESMTAASDRQIEQEKEETAEQKDIPLPETEPAAVEDSGEAVPEADGDTGGNDAETVSDPEADQAAEVPQEGL